MSKITYRMSECGHCPKRLSYNKLGYEPIPAPKWLETSAEEGHWHEERIKQEIRADDIAVYAEQDEISLEFDTFDLLGHIDGIVCDHGTVRLLEIKSMSQFEFNRWMRGGFVEFPQYADQLTAYMCASGQDEALYIVKNRNNGYTDQRIIRQPGNLENIVNKLTEVTGHILQEETTPAEYNPDSFECRRCEYRQHCMPLPPVLAQDQEKELMEATEKWRQGKKSVDEGTELVEQARATLRQYTEQTPEQKMQFNDLSMMIYLVHTVRYPKKLVEEKVPPAILAEIVEFSDRYDLKITDLAKENDE